MRDAEREPFGNMRFRLEIEGLRETGAVEVIFPEARLTAGPRRSRVVQYGTLTIRRGVTPEINAFSSIRASSSLIHVPG